MAPMSTPVPSPAAPGSERIAAWARERGLQYRGFPDQQWFAAWEPYDTMIGAEAYLSSVSWALPPGTATIAEPWLAPLDAEPLDRTLLVFVSHPRFVRRAAARSGEHFNTRVAYLEAPPPPTVRLGDPAWDERVVTLAASPSEAAAAFPPAARRLLLEWRFSGHLELRPGGLVVHFAGLLPIPEHVAQLVRSVPGLVGALVAG
jgi:hypothetical protein